MKPNHFVIVLAAFCFFIFGAHADGLAELFGDGVPGVEEKDYDKAVARLTRQIQDNPTNEVAIYFRGRIYLQQGKYAESSMDADALVKKKSPLGYLLRGSTFYVQKKYGLAIADWSELTQMMPRTQSYFLRACAERNLSNYEKAVVDFGEAIRLDANNINAYYQRAVCFSAEQDYGRSIADFNIVVRMNPLHAPTYASRGFVYFQKGDYAMAVKDFDRALLVDTNCADAYNNYAWLLSVCPDDKYRDGEKAVRYARRACEINGWREPFYLGTRAAAFAEVTNFTDAIKWQEQSIDAGLLGKDLVTAREILDLYKTHIPYRAIIKKEDGVRQLFKAENN